MKLTLKTLVATAVIAYMLVGSSAFCAQTWPMFRQNNSRTGLDAATAPGDLGPYRPTPIWVFPAPQTTEAVVDNVDPEFTVSGTWNSTTLNAVGPYGQVDPLYIWATTDKTGSNTASWSFKFDGTSTNKYTLKAGSLTNFYVYVWLPSPGTGETPEHSRDAHYTVKINTKVIGTYLLDQTSGGGWTVLSWQSFPVSSTDTLVVTLSSQSEETDSDGAFVQRQVIADAVQLRTDIGTVVASPVVSVKDPTLMLTSTLQNVPLIGDGGMGNAGVGVVYGVGTEVNSGISSGLDDRGLQKWRYPAQDHDWIWGGISATPALADYSGSENAVVPGLDGTVYVFDTGAAENTTPATIWKGPGYFVDEAVGMGSWTPTAGMGRQGASYLETPAVKADTPTATARWTVTIPTSGLARAYDIYAWIPPATNGHLFVGDARYTEIGTDGNPVDGSTVNVYQGSGGFWAPIKMGYKIAAGAPNTPITYELSNRTVSDPVADPRYVVADTLKLVPSGLVGFDFCSPAVDSSGDIYVGSSTLYSADTKGRIYKLHPGSSEPAWTFPNSDQEPIGGIYASPTLSPTGDTLYVGSSDGHIYALTAAGGNPGFSKLKWVYPSGTDAPLAQISSTAAVTDVFGNTRIYFATGGAWGSGTGLEGKVYCIEDAITQANPVWMYPSGTNILGAFVYGSPLLVKQTSTDPQPKLSIGSTDGKLYTLDLAGNGDADPSKGLFGTTNLIYSTDLSSDMESSPAGSYVSFAPYSNKATPRTGGQTGMAFVGAGSRICGVDLQTGLKDWWWDLSGSTVSSPAIAKSRIYTGDVQGYTWAFSSGTDATGAGAEGWNSDLGAAPPSTGSDPPAGTVGKQAAPEVDVFTKAEWETLKKNFLEKAEHSGDPADWFDSKKIRDYVMDHAGERPPQYQFEWGEDFYIVVWNLIDRNRPGDGTDTSKWHKRYTTTKDANGKFTEDPAFSDDYQGSVKITIKSHSPGKAADSTNSFDLNGREIDFFNDKSAVNPNDSTDDGYACFYAAKLYALDGSSSSNPQTPGGMFTITATELPSSPNMSSQEIPVPHKPSDVSKSAELREPQEFAINNPLGIEYSGSYTGIATAMNVGVTAGHVANRSDADAQVNGDLNAPPIVWGGFTPHNKLSDTRTLTVCDRSLLSTTGRKISKFRIQRQDLKWNGGVNQIINPLPWEAGPGSDDYPDIDLRQIRLRMQTNGQDPSLNALDLMPGTNPGTPSPSTWTVGLNPVNVAVQVPQFQPANYAMDSSHNLVTDDASMKASGYTNTVFAFVDSNGNGLLDRPAALGTAALQSQKVSGTKSEAYREVQVQVHVPADYRAEIDQQRINIGEVPQGFGFTSAGNNIPQVFDPNLVSSSPTDPWAPLGFSEWFKSFTARNTGNVNLVNVGLYRTDLLSDTVQQPIAAPSGTSVIPNSGYYIPASTASKITNPCLVSTLDTTFYDGTPYKLGPGFWSSVPPPATTPAIPSRTFHKARVGEAAPELKLPDYPQWAQFPTAPMPQQPPALSVAVPLGTPVGTYSGKVQLAETEFGKTMPISNPLEVVVTATESRLTGGATLSGSPHLAHLDNPPMPAPGATSETAASGTPAAYRDPTTGNVTMFWSSSRYPGGGSSTSADPWYLYGTTLTNNPNTGWQLTPGQSNTWQWWTPTVTSSAFPSAGGLSTFFPSADPSDPTLGAPGTLIPGSVRFSSPSVAVDEVTDKAYLLFLGQAYKDDAAGVTSTSGLKRSLESRAYYAEIKNGGVAESDVYSTSPNFASTTVPSPPHIRGDWTTAKFGIRGVIMRPAANDDPQLWSFWYGGGNGKWRIYYNMKMDPSTPPKPSNPNTQWTNEAMLPVPKGLSSTAEPSPIVHTWQGATGHAFEVAYAGVSSFHKNSDIYLSRYTLGPIKTPNKPGAAWQSVNLELLPQRAQPIPEMLDSTGTARVGERLTRDPSRSIWYSRDVDWLANDVSVTDSSATTPPDFQVFIRPDQTSTTVYRLNIGETTKDTTTGAIAYTYDPTPGGDAAIESQKATLRTLFRAVVINPADGTVKFMRPPSGQALVMAIYFPRAYRLTTDGVADGSPCAVMDDDPNPAYSLVDPGHSPFFMPGTWDQTISPPSDRVWIFWRRPTMDKPGTGIYYKAHRYTVQLSHQIRMIKTTQGGNLPPIYTPDVSGITAMNAQPENALTCPVEIDWVKNRLYFCGADGTDVLPNPGSPNDPLNKPYPKKVQVDYTDANGTPQSEVCYVQFADEDISQPGKTFGNLTSLMVNEGQVNAFKDPLDNKLWVFWSSTRSGTPDLYYETISPRFIGREYK